MNSGGGRKTKVPSMPLLSQRKDSRDEDLLLFKELHKREKNRLASLLQPDSDEFEPNSGNYSLYRIASGKKGTGYDLFGEKEKEKNDYDWLKTPPATPLFPSLEMEAIGAPELVIQRELPIVQPLSRFAGNSGAQKGSNNNFERPKSPKPKPRISQRSMAPSQSSSTPSQTKTFKGTTILNQKTTPSSNDLNNKKTNMNTNKNTRRITDNHVDSFLASNLSKTLAETTMDALTTTKTKPKSRGVSPSMRSTISTQILGFSDETPSNLKTTIDRSISATRGRPNTDRLTSVTRDRPNTDRSTSTMKTRTNSSMSTPLVQQNIDDRQVVARSRRQSCSPGVTRGRKVEAKEGEGKRMMVNSGTQNNFVGSKMVEKMMNARKNSIGDQEKPETKTKSRGASISHGNAFGSLMSKSSLDMALKHMDIKQDRINPRLRNTMPSKNSTRDEF